VFPSPTSPLENTVANGPQEPVGAGAEAFGGFRTGELVEVCTDSVRALARVREVSHAGRLHIAFEMGEYLPWVDAAVLIRHASPAASAASGASGASGASAARGRGCVARILHAGTSTALLQVLGAVEELPPGREPFDTVPLLDE
jgi:hypothetical protein